MSVPTFVLYLCLVIIFFVSWECVIFLAIFYALQFFFKLNVFCRMAEAEVNNLYAWKRHSFR